MTFRTWQIDQALLLPPSVHDFVPAGHPARFVRDLVREDLDLSAIVAQGLTENAADSGQLIPLLDAIEATTGCKPREASADVGYCSEANLDALAARRVRGYIATRRQKHPEGGEQQRRSPRVEAMRQRPKRGGRRSRYRLTKQTVEPVFGQIKEARGFRQFLMRGIEKVRGEWAILCTVHSILKLQKAS